METRAIIFDVGGVMIGLDFSRAVKHAALALRRDPADIARKLFGAGDPLSADRMAYLDDYECGRINDAEFHRCVEARLEGRLPFDAFKAAWNDVFLDPIAPTLEIAQALRRRGELKLAILSNNNAMHWAELLTRLPALDIFDHIFLSHEIGLRKPGAAAFEHALARMNVLPAETVFVDDLSDNIESAARLGFKTVWALDATAVRLGLAKLGVI